MTEDAEAIKAALASANAHIAELELRCKAADRDFVGIEELCRDARAALQSSLQPEGERAKALRELAEAVAPPPPSGKEEA